jgi:hypothetical protein
MSEGTTGKYLLVETTCPCCMRCKSAPEIVRRSDIDIALAELKKINVPQVAMVSLRS